MGHLGRGEHFWSFQLKRSVLQVLKEPDPIPQEHRRQVQVEFVEQTSLETLIGKLGTTQHIDLFLTRNSLCLGKHALNTLSNEGKGCSSILDQLFSLPMSK